MAIADEIETWPMRKWRCSRGHKWESKVEIVGLRFKEFKEAGIPAAAFCMLCLYERANDGLGRVREDT